MATGVNSDPILSKFSPVGRYLKVVGEGKVDVGLGLETAEWIPNFVGSWSKTDDPNKQISFYYV